MDGRSTKSGCRAARHIRGKYWLTVELPDGKKQTVHKTAPNGKEAQRRLEKWKSDVARDEYDSPAAEKLTVNDIFDHYERYMEREGIKSRSFPSMIRYMRSKFGKVPALRLTTKRVEKFEEEEKAWRKARRERLDEERRARGMHVRDYGFPPPEVVTVQNYLACLRAAYRHAAKGKPPPISERPGTRRARVPAYSARNPSTISGVAPPAMAYAPACRSG